MQTVDFMITLNQKPGQTCTLCIRYEGINVAHLHPWHHKRRCYLFFIGTYMLIRTRTPNSVERNRNPEDTQGFTDIINFISQVHHFLDLSTKKHFCPIFLKGYFYFPFSLPFSKCNLWASKWDHCEWFDHRRCSREQHLTIGQLWG